MEAIVLTELARLRGAPALTNERDPKPSPGSRSPPNNTLLLWPAHTSSGENSRTKVQNVEADRSVVIAIILCITNCSLTVC